MTETIPELHHQVRRALTLGTEEHRQSCLARLHETHDPTEDLWRMLFEASRLRYVDAPRAREILTMVLHDERVSLAPLAGVTAEHYLFLIDQVYHAVEVDHAGFERLKTFYHDVGSPFGEATVELNHGYAHLIVNRPLQALDYLHRALDAYGALGDELMMGQTKIQVADALMMASFDHGADDDVMKRGLQLLHEVHDTFIKHDVQEFIADVLGRIGNVHFAENDFTTALTYAHKALAMCEQVPVSERSKEQLMETTDCLSQIAHIHTRARNLEAARLYTLQALDICPDSYVDARYGGLERLGVIETWEGNDALALSYYHQALDHAAAHGLPINAILQYNIAHSQVRLGNINEARAAAEQGRRVLRQGHHALAWSAIVEAQIMLHDGQYEAATQSIDTFLQHHANHMTTWEQIEAHLVMRDVALKQNDLQQYVLHNERATTLTEELRGNKKLLGLAMQEQERTLDAEREEARRHRSILYSTLPKHIADRVARGESVSDHYDTATVIFLDIVGFTTFSDSLPSDQVVHVLDRLFTTLDRICADHHVVKIKTIGDSYMAVAFPEHGTETGERRPETEHVERAAQCALEMMRSIVTVDLHDLHDNAGHRVHPLQARIGIHSGPLTAGVIGTERLQYDVWGDTVNVASRMESTGEPGRIQVSEAFASALRASEEEEARSEEREGAGLRSLLSALRLRGETAVKGKGSMVTYWLERK